MARVLVTGANGYIGSAVVWALVDHGHHAVAGTRMPVSRFEAVRGVEPLVYGDLTEMSNFRDMLEDIEVVIHTAAAVHKKAGSRTASPTVFHGLNADVVARLASDACAVDVKQIVFLSTIAVHGSRSDGAPVDENSPFIACSPYAASKLRGEELLQEACADSATSWTIIRPAMVYGSEAPGNFSRLVRAVNRRIPLPVGLLDNRRSIMSVDDLVSLVLLTMERPSARNEVFVAADSSPISTREIVEAIAVGTGKRAFSWPLPPGILRLAGGLLRMESTVSSLADDFVVDSGKACRLLGWKRRSDSRSEIVRYLQSSASCSSALAGSQ